MEACLCSRQIWLCCHLRNVKKLCLEYLLAVQWRFSARELRTRHAMEGGKEVREVRRRDRMEGKKRNVRDGPEGGGDSIWSALTHSSGEGERVSLRRAPWNPRSLSPRLASGDSCCCRCPSVSWLFWQQPKPISLKIRIKSWKSVSKNNQIGQNDFMKVRVIWFCRREKVKQPSWPFSESFPSPSSKQN